MIDKHLLRQFGKDLHLVIFRLTFLYLRIICWFLADFETEQGRAFVWAHFLEAKSLALKFQFKLLLRHFRETFPLISIFWDFSQKSSNFWVLRTRSTYLWFFAHFGAPRQETPFLPLDFVSPTQPALPFWCLFAQLPQIVVLKVSDVLLQSGVFYWLDRVRPFRRQEPYQQLDLYHRMAVFYFGHLDFHHIFVRDLFWKHQQRVSLHTNFDSIIRVAWKREFTHDCGKFLLVYCRGADFVWSFILRDQRANLWDF